VTLPTVGHNPARLTDAFIVDGIRTPIGNLGGALSEVRSDDLAAHVIRTVLARNASADPSRLAVLEALRDGRRCVSDLVRLTGLTQPNVSAHLACPHLTNLSLQPKSLRS